MMLSEMLEILSKKIQHQIQQIVFTIVKVYSYGKLK